MITYWLTGEKPTPSNMNTSPVVSPDIHHNRRSSSVHVLEKPNTIVSINENKDSTRRMSQRKIKDDTEENLKFPKSPFPLRQASEIPKKEKHKSSTKHRVYFKNITQSKYDIATKSDNKNIPLASYTTIN